MSQPDYLRRAFVARLPLFQSCSCAVRGALPPLALGEHIQQKSPRVPRPSAPQGAPGRVSARCQRLFPAGQCPGRPGLALRREGGVPAATMQQPRRKSRARTRSAAPSSSSSSSSSAPLPPRGTPGQGVAAPKGLLLLQPGSCRGKGSQRGVGGHIQLPSGGAELPEPCQHRLLLWETTSCQGRNLAALQTSTGATGISLQRLFFRVIYFQVWSVRTIPCLEIVGVFLTAIMTVRKRL